MLPLRDDDHTDEGVALLISRYRDKPVVSGIIRALMSRFQKYEAAYWSLIEGVILDNHPMAGGPWDILDKLGKIVEVPRNGRTDAQYVPAIRLRIRVLRSHGLAEDIIQIAALIMLGAVYREWYPAAFEIQAIPVTSDQADALTQNLGSAKAAGTAGNLRWAVSAANNVTWDSTRVPGVGVGFASSRTGTPPNTPVSLRQLTRIPI